MKKLLFFFGCCTIFLTFFFAAKISSAQSTSQGNFRDELYYTYLETRNGGPLPDSNPLNIPFIGARWIENPMDYSLAPARRALEYIMGVDVTGTGRDSIVKSLLSNWQEDGSIPEEDVDVYKYMAPSLFFSPDGGSGSSSTSGSVAGISDTGVGFEGLNDLVENFLPFGNTTYSVSPLIRIQALNKRAQVASAANTGIGTTGLTPIMEKEDTTGNRDSSNNTLELSGNLNKIQTPTYMLQQKANDVISSAQRVALAEPNVTGGLAKSDPSNALPAPYASAEKQEKIESTQDEDSNAASMGKTAEVVGLARGPLFAQNMIDQSDLNQMLNLIANQINQNNQLNQLLNNFFGNNLNGLSDAFGNNLGNLLNNFPTPSSGDSVANTPRNSNEPTGECVNQTKQYSEDEAISIALVLGLPYSSSSTLNTNYVSRNDVNGVQGTNEATGADVTLLSSDFSSTCIWVIATSSNNKAAFIDDARSTTATKILLDLSL